MKEFFTVRQQKYHNLIAFIFIFIMIAVFCKKTLDYLYETNLYDNDDGDYNYYYNKNNNNFKAWLRNNKNSNNFRKQTTLCKGMVIEVDDDNEKSCNDISKNLCNNMQKVKIPHNLKIDIYSDNGSKLINGKTYCIYKKPPLLTTTTICDESWGFWQYSVKYEKWLCKSKVPGIYNSRINKFDACNNGGKLKFEKNEYINNDDIPKRFTPEQFYSTDFQKKFSCECAKDYVFNPELSRTMCFEDPCKANLPPAAAVKGYNNKTGECDCSPYFTNLFPDNLKSPCTTCPLGSPSYDPKTQMLTIYIKCNSHFPCVTPEDKIKGCTQAYLKVKPIYDDKEVKTFENLVFL